MEDIVLTFEDILHNEDVASVLIQFLKLEDKRNLRLVAHAGKDAVDKTVTSVDNRFYKSKKSLSILANSNWKGVKRIDVSGYPAGDIIQIAEAGFSKLESLALFVDKDDTRFSAQKMVAAGWKLKELIINGRGLQQSFFKVIVRESHWPLETLFIEDCTSPIAKIIAKSNWPLKHLALETDRGVLSPEAVEQFMKASWIATIEQLALSIRIIEEKGARAIAEASHRATNLNYLALQSPGTTYEEALILGEGSYPSLIMLEIEIKNIGISGLTAILKKCPVLETLIYGDRPLREPLTDPEDAKNIAQHMRLFKQLDLGMFRLSTEAACSLLLAHDWPKVEFLMMGDESGSQTFDIDDEVIAALVQNEWPCLLTMDIVAEGITEEGNRMFSAKEWPVLEELVMDLSAESGLELMSEKLPRLKTLKLEGGKVEMIATGLLEQVWPHLETLSLIVGPDYEEYPPEWIMEVLKTINRAHMPNLKVLMFDDVEISDADMSELEDEAKSIGCRIVWDTPGAAGYHFTDEDDESLLVEMIEAGLLEDYDFTDEDDDYDDFY